MSAPERAPAPTTAGFALHDVTVRVEGPVATVDEVTRRLGHAALRTPPPSTPTIGAVAADDGRGNVVVSVDGRQRFRVADARAAGGRLGQLLHSLVARRARSVLFVHAGAVAFDGRLVVLPGRSGCGKSTLVSAALALGATYFSDEYAVIDPAGLVHPYARAPVLRDSDGRRRVVPVGEGVEVATTAAAPMAVVVTRHVPGSRWRPDLLRGAAAALPVVDNVVLARRRAGATISLAAHIARSAPVVDSPRGDALETAETIGAWVTSLSPAAT